MESIKWWQKSVFYQIYPRSFADGNGDGIGDLIGMVRKLDYLQRLGIDAIWLSPHFPSPQFDCGYDVADYTSVEPVYGTLADFKQFLEGCHERGMHLILDLVLNHTSHLHEWFQESRSSRDDPKRDWYIWRDGRDGGPPNNWVSAFGGSAWEYDPKTGQYYYHYFFKEQPDLNWRNPEVKAAMFDAVRFWLDLGVDGFRLDALGTIFEDPDMTEHPVPYTLEELGKMALEASSDQDRQQLEKYWKEMFQFQVAQPGIHALFKDLRKIINKYPDRLLVAEDDDIRFMGQGDDEIHLVFNFPLMHVERISPAHICQNQKERLTALGKLIPKGWPCNTLGNHDSPRLFNRFGDGTNDLELAKINLTLMLTLKGTPFLYNGEEIGMTDLILEDISQFRDRVGVWYYQSLVEKMGMPPDKAVQIAAQNSRDKNRTPMQWQNSPNAGFCPQGITSWLPVNPNFADGVNVEDQEKDPKSLLSFYKRMIEIRKNTPALNMGEFQVLEGATEPYLAFLRISGQGSCLVVLNYSENAIDVNLSDAGSVQEILFSTNIHKNQPISLNNLHLAPFGIFIALVV